MKLFQSIRSRLFFCYASLIILLISVFTLSFYRYASGMVKSKASDALQQLSININNSIDTEFKNMSSIANRIISSQTIKDTFYHTIGFNHITPQNKFDFFNLLFTVTGSSIDYQINIMDLDGRFIEFGKTYDIYRKLPHEISSKPWILDAIALEGFPSISLPRINEWNSKNDSIISLSRSFYEVFGGPYTGVVEIQQYTSSFENLVRKSIVAYENPVEIYIYNNLGEEIYSSNKALNALDYYTYIQSMPSKQDLLSLDIENKEHTLSFCKSDYTNWTVIVTESVNTLLAPIKILRNMFLGFGLLVLFITLVITYIISRQLTIPISRMYHSIVNLDLTSLGSSSLLALNNTTSELETLNIAYTEMVSRLEQSLEAVVTAKAHEVESKFLALQAQMNPHFLYNTITIMSIKAEQNNQPEIVAMCENLIHMLRYIAKDSPNLVTMKEELDHLGKYIDLMHSRYPSEFSVVYDIPETMLSILIPKLTIQPLIENCFKHAFNNRPPWQLSIKGKVIDNIWHITVTDNGIGFDQGILSHILSSAEDTKLPNHTRVKDHIGLSNILYRLNYHYNKSAIFDIHNNPDGGSTVHIGGCIQEVIS